MTRLPDPGSPRAARLAALSFVALLAIVVGLQQWSTSALRTPTGPARQVEPPATQTALVHSILVRINHASPSPGLAQMAETAAVDPTPAGRLRGAILAHVLGKADASFDSAAAFGAVTREFDAPGKGEPLAADHPLRADLATARDLVAGGAVAAERLATFTEHHEYYARLAATLNAADTDPARVAALGHGTLLMLLLSVAVIGGGVAFFAGVVLLIFALVRLGHGAPTRFVPPARGGSIGLEIAAVFVAGFIALKGVGSLLAVALPHESVVLFTLALQWLLLLALLWPIVRRLPLRPTLTRLGFHKGQGWLVEIGWGIMGWLAGLPVFFAGAIVSAVLMFVYTRLFPSPAGSGVPGNPVIDMVQGTLGSAAIVLLALLAALWAPLAEEAIFRGGLYRHLRSRFNVILAACATAAAFGLMHGYPILMLGPVIALGFAFSILREWRDSLIAPIVAHALHNSLVLGFIITLITLADV